MPSRTDTSSAAPAAPAPPPPPAELPHPVLSENAETVLRRRYLRPRAGSDTLETPREMFWRVAWAIAQTEHAHGEDPEPWATRFYDMMANLRFLPATPTLLNAGRDGGQLAACFVLPVERGQGGILDALRQALEIHRTGGGTGFDLSQLPAAGAEGQAGPLAALRLFDAATEEVKQSGVRRGANMGVLRIDHPDIEAFIDVKRDVSRLPNFNLSVAITDDFLDAVQRGIDYDLIDPASGESAGSRHARAIWHRIAECAWATGEPGLVFIDRMNDLDPMHKVDTIGATNPCGEQGLAPFDACNLGSIDLARHVVHTPGGTPRIDEDALKATIRLAVRFLDDVIDATTPPLDQIRDKVHANRRIGLGVMGLGRALHMLRIPYGSREGREYVDHLLALFQSTAHEASRDLAETRGTFPAWHDSTWADRDIPMRNAAVTTIAPTGTIGMIADTSGGCEPEFSLVYTKHCLDGTTLPYVVPEFVTVAKREGFWHEGLLDELRANGGSARGLDAVPDAWQRVFVTAHDLAPDAHVTMQAVCQRHVDNAVSKTINLPRDSRPEDVEQAFMLAYTEGCKGVTVYRDGSRPDQVLRATADGNPPSERSASARASCRSCVTLAPIPTGDAGARGADPASSHTGRLGHARHARPAGHATGTTSMAGPTSPRPRPPVVHATTHKIDSGCGTVYVTIGEDEHGPVEVIAVRARGNACTSAHLEATSRIASLALRSGLRLEAVARALCGVRCGEPRVTPNGIVFGCVDAIGQALERQALGPLGPQHETFAQTPLESYGRQEADLDISGPPRDASSAPTAND